MERSRRIQGRRFIVPVVIDDDYSGDPSHYCRMRNSFGHLHFGRAPAGVPDDELHATLTTEIRAMRRTDMRHDSHNGSTAARQQNPGRDSSRLKRTRMLLLRAHR